MTTAVVVGGSGRMTSVPNLGSAKVVLTEAKKVMANATVITTTGFRNDLTKALPPLRFSNLALRGTQQIRDSNPSRVPDRVRELQRAKREANSNPHSRKKSFNSQKSGFLKVQVSPYKTLYVGYVR